MKDNRISKSGVQIDSKNFCSVKPDLHKIHLLQLNFYLKYLRRPAYILIELCVFLLLFLLTIIILNARHFVVTPELNILSQKFSVHSSYDPLHSKC